MTRSPIVVIGGGGHCLTIAGVIDAEGKWEIAGFVDPDGAAPLAKLGVPWLGDDDAITDLSIQHAHVGIGQIKSSKKRKAIYERLIGSDIELPVIVAPSAYVASTADIGRGTLVAHGSVVNTQAEIGRNGILNNRCVIEHGVVIGNHCHIAPGAIVLGECSIGDESFVGAGAIVKEGVRIGSNVVVGAGVIVKSDVPDGVVIR